MGNRNLLNESFIYGLGAFAGGASIIMALYCFACWYVINILLDKAITYFRNRR
jgi:hypothetical protein